MMACGPTAIPSYATPMSRVLHELTPLAQAMVSWSDQFSAPSPLGGAPPYIRYGYRDNQSCNWTSRKNLRTVHRFASGTKGSACGHHIPLLSEGSIRGTLAHYDEGRRDP